jgi:phage protein
MNEIGEKFLLYGFLDGCSYETDGTNNAILALETGERIEVPIGCLLKVDELNRLVRQNKIKLAKKVALPEFVNKWLEYCKNTSVTLTRALLVDDVDFYNYANQKDFTRLKDFLIVEKNQELFARAWIFGCTVKEKRYLVKVRGISKYSAYLNRDVATNKWFMSSENNYPDKTITHHTRLELEKAGLGNVFDNPSFKVKEVEE